MQTTVQNFRDNLRLLAPVANGAKALPITRGVLLSKGRAIATDLQVSLVLEMPEASDVSCVLPFAQAMDYLKRLPGYLDLDVSIKGQEILIKAGNSSATLIGAKADEFPPVPAFDPKACGAIDGDRLLTGLRAVAPFVATEDTRPVLTAVCITLGDPIELAAADGFRLSWTSAKGELPAIDGIKQLLLPGKAVGILDHLWRHGAKPVTSFDPTSVASLAVATRPVAVSYTKTLMEVRFGRMTAVIQLLDGTYPDYKQLIPQDSKSRVTFFAEELQRAIKTVAAIASGARIVWLSWEDETMKVSGHEAEVGSTQIELTVTTEKEPGHIAFNQGNLLDYLEGKQGPLTMETTTPSGPAKFSYHSKADHVLMPMQVQG